MERNLNFEEFKELTEKLVQTEDLSCVPESIDRLFREVTNVEQETLIDAQKAQTEMLSVNLWNWGVSKRAAMLITAEQKVKLYYVACKLMFMFDGNSPGEDSIKRLVMMTVKTGKGWIDVGQPALADGFLKTAQKYLEMLAAELLAKSNGPEEEDMWKNNLSMDLFKVFSYRAEAAVAQGHFQLAVMLVDRCQDLLRILPPVPGYLSVLCYNFGVETYHQKKFEECSYWLGQSYGFGKLDEDNTNRQEMKSKILRLLANTYLEWGVYPDKALETINLANEEFLHPSGLYIKIKILLKLKASDEELQEAIMKLLEFKVTSDFLLKTTKLLVDNGRDAVGFGFLKILSNLFEESEDLGKVFLLHIELLLQKKESQLAKEKVESLLSVHLSGKELPSIVLYWLHNVLWDQAAQRFEAQNYSEALQWYNYSLSFSSINQVDVDLAKLQRNRASCYIHLKQLEKATEAVKEAEKYDATNVFTLFTLFKIAVLKGNTDEALLAADALEQSAANPAAKENIISKEDLAPTFLTLAAQFALKNGKEDVAVRALEYLTQHCKDLQQVIIAFKCLIRLIVTKVSHLDAPEEYRKKEMSRLRTFLKIVHQKLDDPAAKEELTLDIWIDEAHWFRKMAWNLAMQCENYPGTMRDFFLLSYKLSQFCPSEKAVLTSQKTCLLMAAAADLELGRKTSDIAVQVEMLTHALQYIQGCKEIVNALKIAEDYCRDPTENLLLLYEIEARAKLKDANLYNFLAYVWELPYLEPKILETIAALTMEHPANYPDISRKALKIALTLYLRSETMDGVKFSKCLHNFIDLSLPNGVMDADMCALQEVWSSFEDALHVISYLDFPQMEILWLMTKAWNTGIYYYSIGMYQTAEKWCSMGMRFLTYSGSLKKYYEVQMTHMYREILDKAESERNWTPTPNEE
ncbi:testis-expressed protein 11 isoform X2 [Macrotis lagotis]|uniref:testis-expressed protein 11 isoform X2 n=1 Tax=Macrotis lagotis TaxID=92651 RepID=UPI003D687C66